MVSAPGLFRRAVHNFSPPTKRLSTVTEKRFLSHQNFSSTKNLANKSTNNTSFTRVVFTPMFEAATGDHYLSLGSRRPRYESGTASHVKPNSVVQMQCTQVERRVKRKKNKLKICFFSGKKECLPWQLVNHLESWRTHQREMTDVLQQYSKKDLGKNRPGIQGYNPIITCFSKVSLMMLID